MQVTINLDVIEFESRGEEFTFDPAKVPEEKREEFFAIAAAEGISKALIDAGSSAKTYAAENEMTVEEATRVLVDKRMATMTGGEWSGKRSTGDDAIMREMISLVRKPVSGLDAAAYKNAEESDRKEMCRKYLKSLPAAQQETYRKQAEALVAFKAKQAEAKAKLAKELGIKL